MLLYAQSTAVIVPPSFVKYCIGSASTFKTTLLKIICKKISNNGGTISLGAGVSIGYYDQAQDNLDDSKTIFDEISDAYPDLNNTKIRNTLAAFLFYGEDVFRPISSLSGGEKGRVSLAKLMLSHANFLILDEPTTGLDPQTRQLIWNVIEKLQKTENLTVFLTTHYMEEAADAGYVVILDKGSIAAQGTPFELKNNYVQDIVSVYGVSEDEIKKLNREYKKIRDGYQIKVRNTKEATKLIIDHQELFTDYEVVKGGMDDVFLAVTGKKLGGER